MGGSQRGPGAAWTIRIVLLETWRGQAHGWAWTWQCWGPVLAAPWGVAGLEGVQGHAWEAPFPCVVPNQAMERERGRKSIEEGESSLICNISGET